MRRGPGAGRRSASGLRRATPLVLAVKLERQRRQGDLAGVTTGDLSMSPILAGLKRISITRYGIRLHYT